MLSKIKNFYRNHPLWSAIIGIALCGLVGLWLCMIFLDVWTHHGDNTTVPHINDMPYAEAERLLVAHGLSIEISDSIYDKSIAPGTVIESWPKAGAVVKSGRNIYVTVTAFSPKHVTLSRPLTGVSVRQTVAYLKALGITGIRLVEVPSLYPDLVEGARVDGHAVGVGSVVAVDATVTLEVGVSIPEETFEPDSTAVNDAEAAVEEDLQTLSTYTDI